jgi:hypothetical protein
VQSVAILLRRFGSLFTWAERNERKSRRNPKATVCPTTWQAVDVYLLCDAVLSETLTGEETEVQSPNFHKKKIQKQRKISTTLRWQRIRTRTPTMSVVLLINYESYYTFRPPLWSSGQRSWLQILRSQVRFPALQDFLRSSGSGTGSTQPRKDNWGVTWMKK